MALNQIIKQTNDQVAQNWSNLICNSLTTNNLIINDEVIIDGDLFVTGELTVEGETKIEDNLIVEQNLDVTGQCFFRNIVNMISTLNTLDIENASAIDTLRLRARTGITIGDVSINEPQYKLSRYYYFTYEQTNLPNAYFEPPYDFRVSLNRIGNTSNLNIYPNNTNNLLQIRPGATIPLEIPYNLLGNDIPDFLLTLGNIRPSAPISIRDNDQGRYITYHVVLNSTLQVIELFKDGGGAAGLDDLINNISITFNNIF